MSGVDCGGDDNDDVVVIAGVCVCVRAQRGMGWLYRDCGVMLLALFVLTERVVTFVLSKLGQYYYCAAGCR